MSTENFLLAFGKSLPVWCIGAVLGWLLIPLMSTNLDALVLGVLVCVWFMRDRHIRKMAEDEMKA